MGYFISNVAILLHILIYSTNAQTIGDVRLQGGSNVFEGRVEIYQNSEWKTVCLDNFDITDANVVCQQLFQESAIAVLSGSEFGAGTSNDSLTGVACTDSDTTLGDCSNSGYSTCSNHAGINCQYPGYFGCYTNIVVSPLRGALYTGRIDLTITDCIERCRNAAFTYSGTISGNQCACGNTIEQSPGDDSRVSESFCNVACSGDSSEICGGNGYTSIYVSSIGQDGGSYTLPEGYIYSPNFPSSYLGELASWMVTLENPTYTTVRILMFGLLDDDQLILRSGSLMETILGSQTLELPYVWQTDLSSLFEIQLIGTQQTDPRNGIAITYEAITGSCGGTFTGTSGYIASPEFPQDSPVSSSCEYTITVPENFIITVTVEQRVLPSGSSLSLIDDGGISSISTTDTFGPSSTNVVKIFYISGTTSSSFLVNYTASQRPCDTLPNISNGTLDPNVSGPVYPPISVNFTCVNGYSSPNSSVTCMEDGTWTSAACIVICDAVPGVQFGLVDTDGVTEFHPDDEITLSCNHGYTPSTSVIECLSVGSWTDAECIEIPLTTIVTTPKPTTTPIVEQSTAQKTTERISTTLSTSGMPSSSPTGAPSTQSATVTVATMTPQAMTTAQAGASTAVATTARRTTHESEKATTRGQSTSDLCRVSVDPIMESLDITEEGNVLALNVGNPLDCEGYLTGIEIFSSDTSTVTISVLRFLEINMYQLIGRFEVVGQNSQVVEHRLERDHWIQFESGDMIGTSSMTSSPLTYSDDQPDSVEYMIWELTDEDFHNLEIGTVIDLTNTNNRPSRTYSWAVFITENMTCAKPDIENAKISPDQETYHYTTTIEVECEDGYSGQATLECRADGTFETFTCDDDNVNSYFLIIGVVIVAVLGLLIIIVILTMVCVEEEHIPERAKIKKSTFSSTGSGRSDNSQRYLIPIEDDGMRGGGVAVSNPLPIADERPSGLADPQYPPIDYPLDDEREAIQAIDEAVLGFDIDGLSFDSSPIDGRSGGDSARHHVTFSDRR